jgi:3-phosphoshikimate 1-carboxyvinyltransferase
MFKTPFLDIPPLHSAAGTVKLPGSKSISNRVLLLAALSTGRTRIHDLLDSDDTRVMLQALAALGCEIERHGPHEWSLSGVGGQWPQRQADLFLGNAGTAMRPLTAALALSAARDGGHYSLRGVARMHERPIADLLEALRHMGCELACTGQEGYPPLQITGPATLNLSQPIRVRGDVSSQFLTALLMALPLLSQNQALTIEVTGALISKPYIAITLALMKRFGVTVDASDWQRFVVPAGSRYTAPAEIHVEADASSASYFMALGAIAAHEAPVRIEGVGLDSIQGDIAFADAARAMGAQVVAGPNWLEVSRGENGQGWPLRPIDLDCNAIPDAAMTLAVMALYASGPSRLRNIASWRVKETDRIAAMACELRKLGAQVEEGPDELRITPPTTWKPAAVHTYDDHRVAMCFSLASFSGLTGARPPVDIRIEDPACVAKTFPDYFEHFFGLVDTETSRVPVITVDGPTASGKGTLASAVAKCLGYHFLDSGAVYRATAWYAHQRGISLDDAHAVAAVAHELPLHFDGSHIYLQGQEVSQTLRREDVGLMASKVSAHTSVRQALQHLQLSFRRLPGLVADGRDMGTAIFPGADLKVYLTASAATRAQRRHKQLISKGIQANIEDLRRDLEARDLRDRSRSASPLKPAEDALLLDNSTLGIEESVQWVLQAWQKRRPFGA